MPIDPALFEPLREHLTNEQLVELGMLCATFLGFSRFMATFEVFDCCPLPTQEIAAPVYSVLV